MTTGKLTPRQYQVLETLDRLLATNPGRITQADIAVEIGISQVSVSTHMRVLKYRGLTKNRGQANRITPSGYKAMDRHNAGAKALELWKRYFDEQGNSTAILLEAERLINENNSTEGCSS